MYVLNIRYLLIIFCHGNIVKSQKPRTCKNRNLLLRGCGEKTSLDNNIIVLSIARAHFDTTLSYDRILQTRSNRDIYATKYL